MLLFYYIAIAGFIAALIGAGTLKEGRSYTPALLGLLVLAGGIYLGRIWYYTGDITHLANSALLTVLGVAISAYALRDQPLDVVSVEDVLVCPDRGTELRDGYCTDCRRNYTTVLECPLCGTENPEDATECSGCGVPFK